MRWSKPQQIMLHKAAKLAEWNEKMRYIAMRHAGCPNDRAKGRPSITHSGNTQRQFELVMSIAEGQWLGLGGAGEFPRPRDAKRWSDITAQTREPMMRFAREIWAEARERRPERFDAGGLDGFVQRMASRTDARVMFQPSPRTLDEVHDPALLHRILEGLKAWVGREFIQNDITPRSFKIPASERRKYLSGAA